MAKHRLWAPWRSEYLKREKSSDCIFCSKPTGDDESGYIVHRGDRCYVMLNAFPYNSGHVMVAPYDHRADLRDLEPPVASELTALTQSALDAIQRVYGPQGFNLGANLGEIAGAGFAGHFHMHVVPRWTGDTNFMPVVGDVRVLPETLEETWRKLRDAFEVRA